ncbi:MAG: DUF1697 domain-containing protein [Hyphomicrobiales bacterium]|nr:DUF1697 domain-containing protein [Hyphomicrobiales bacterium]
MPVFIALLRAVNVGGRGKLPMVDLKRLCDAARFRAVRTVGASGNVVAERDGAEGGDQGRARDGGRSCRDGAAVYCCRARGRPLPPLVRRKRLPLPLTTDRRAAASASAPSPSPTPRVLAR